MSNPTDPKIEEIRALIVKHKRWDVIFSMIGLVAMMIGVITLLALFIDLVLDGYGRLTWDPPLSAVRDVDPAVLRSADGLTVRVQLLDPAHLPAWPTERRALVQRYTDAPPADLTVPTLPAFAVAKTAAWHDRHAPRDLYDLWGLARLGALDAAAGRLFTRLGPTGQPPKSWMFDTPPTAADWTAQLGGQTRVAVGPAEALTVVREAWAATQAALEGEMARRDER